MPRTRSVSIALREFHAAHARLLVAAERLRTEMEKAAGEPSETTGRGQLRRSVLARQQLAGVPPAAPADIRVIQGVICEHFGITLLQLCSMRRDHHTAWARFIAWVICRQLTKFSLYQVAEAFGRTDHTGLSYGFKEVEQRCELEPAFAAQVQLVTAKCRAALVQLPATAA